ncbi:MAG: hypothetical protein IPL79_10420 [Myxococcales bacterium]|nr:hypothetical protein [Myxococcales bacterium]
MATPTGRTEYSRGGHHGVSIFAASIATSGKTRFQCESDDTFQIAIGTGLGLGIVASVLSAFAGFGVAVFLFFKTFLRRKRDQQAVSA